MILPTAGTTIARSRTWQGYPRKSGALEIHGDNGILKGYLENTFRRLYEEGKVTEEKEYALFHTGLFNQYYQPIYAYFVPNIVPDRQKWYLEGFYTDYSLLKIQNQGSSAQGKLCGGSL